MRFIAGGLNGNYLREINEGAISDTDEILAAVAYATNEPDISRMFDSWWDNKIKLTFWCRYDYSIPVALPLLDKFLKRASPNFICRLVPDIFHPKVIWWKGYGVYIGSANLTERGWYRNIEAGLFIENGNLAGTILEAELDEFFKAVDDRSYPLTDEVYEHLLRFQQTNNNQTAQDKLREKFDSDKSRLAKLNPLTFVSRVSTENRALGSFLEEWNETLQYLRDIASRVSTDKYRPSWVPEKTPSGVQVDQFLHAYYYGCVRDGVQYPFNNLYERHKNNPEGALVEAMEWWSSLERAPNDEDTFIVEWAPFLKEHLAQNRLLDLTLDEFTGICERVHAIREHCLRLPNKVLGPDAVGQNFKQEEKIPLFAEVLYRNRSKAGNSVLQTIHHVLYGGPVEHTPQRIWEGFKSDEWHIDHLGLSSLGEIVGWALPDHFPPRNDRTNKALKALGYKVRVYSG